MKAVVLALIVLYPGGGIAQADERQATPHQWKMFAQDLGTLQATLAQAEAMLVGPSWRWKECRFQSLNRPTWTAKEERLTAVCATRKTGVSLSTLSSVISCESGWDRFAYNSGGPYVGLAQHALSAYASRIATYEPPAWKHPLSTKWTNARGQLVMTARMVQAVGWSPWSCA